MHSILTNDCCHLVPIVMASDPDDEAGEPVPQEYAPANMVRSDPELQSRARHAACVALETWRMQWGVLDEVNDAARAAERELLRAERESR